MRARGGASARLASYPRRVNYPAAAAVLVAIALTSAACGSIHRVRATSGASRPTSGGGVAAPGRGPTKYSCAAAWNRDAPPSVLAWGRRLRVWEATVNSGQANESTVSFVGGGHANTTAKKEIETCEVVLFAPRGRATILNGTWVRGAVVSWGHPFRVRRPSGSGNACVAHDGTIHHVGPFTASSRCPRTA